MTVWIVKAALKWIRGRGRPTSSPGPRRTERRGRSGGASPEGQTSSVAVPWTAAVLQLAEGAADDPACSCRSCGMHGPAPPRTARRGWTYLRLDRVIPVFPRDTCSVSSISPSGPVSRMSASRGEARRSTATTRVWSGCSRRPPSSAGRKVPRLRVLGRRSTVRPSREGTPLRGVLPQRYGLDVVAADAAPERGSRPPEPRTGSGRGRQAGSRWLAAQQLEGRGWAAAESHHEVAATALAVQAFLRHGYSNRGGTSSRRSSPRACGS